MTVTATGGDGHTAHRHKDAAADDQAKAWIKKMLLGDRTAIARLITCMENDAPQARQVASLIYPHIGRALVVGFTGASGVGKSTLISAYVSELRKRRSHVGVVAVDPTSPLTGGALLGDRLRMSAHSSDPGVFIRSLASRGHLGGLSKTTARIVDVLDAAGFEHIIVETVGTGQSEVEVAQLADLTIVVCTSGHGDVIQFEKAGILEIADLFVVNKSDLPGADRVVAELNGMLVAGYTKPHRPPVIQTHATTAAGVAELIDQIGNIAQRCNFSRESRVRRRARLLLASAAAEWFRHRLSSIDDPQLDKICLETARGVLDYEAAVEEVLAHWATRDE